MNVGRTLIVVGLVLVAVGALYTLTERSSLPLGRLPGDITYRGKNTTVYFPVVTCLVISAVLSILMWLFGRR